MEIANGTQHSLSIVMVALIMVVTQKKMTIVIGKLREGVG